MWVDNIRMLKTDEERTSKEVMKCQVDSILVLRTDEERATKEDMKCEVDSILVLGTNDQDVAQAIPSTRLLMRILMRESNLRGGQVLARNVR